MFKIERKLDTAVQSSYRLSNTFFMTFLGEKYIIFHDLANDMVRNGVIPSDWEDSFIINIYKVMLWREVTTGLKLLGHVMKGIERVIIRGRISIDDMQFDFMPGRGTTDAIFILRQLQEKHLAKNKKLYFAFVDLGVRSRTKKSHLVGQAKTWHRGMDCAIRAGYVQQHQKQS